MASALMFLAKTRSSSYEHRRVPSAAVVIDANKIVLVYVFLDGNRKFLNEKGVVIKKLYLIEDS